ncbi:MAG: hypothetical protein ACFHHU_15935 [Porticoccaceae bacterium]|uniref:hypothetical protein n=1 Tax=Thalassospira sp. TaxID=1912094 RepID=UPI003A89E055
MFAQWRESLQHFMDWFLRKRAEMRFFFAKLFTVFILINLGCYWWALLTTYPHLLNTWKGDEYILMGFPVAVMGAMFDALSFYVTVEIIRRALVSKGNIQFVSYLSVDILIAIVATFWVLFAFVASGWLVSQFLDRPETMTYRTDLYEGRFWKALQDPFAPDNLRNIYFGMMMGASALLPTLYHFGLALFSALRWVFGRFKVAGSQS